jgi:hypothetical protein
VALITGHARIAAPAGQVPDTVAGLRNEPSFNPAMAGAELLTPLPTGLGTRFRARTGRAGTQMPAELAAFAEKYFRCGNGPGKGTVPRGGFRGNADALPARRRLVGSATCPRQIRIFTRNAPMHKYTVGYLACWAITSATNYVKSG